MFWSLSKIIAFVAAVALLSFGAVLLLESDGIVRIEFANREISMTPLALLILAVLAVPVVWSLVFLLGLLQAAVKFLIGDETALTRYLNRNRERKGYEALANSLISLSSGEPKNAISDAEKAERYLSRPEITGILIAQAAEKTGDKKRAEQAYRDLIKDERTKFVGIVGVLKQKLQDNEIEVAMRLAEKAFAINPRHEEIQNALFRLQSGMEDWSGARTTLAAKLKSKALPKDVHARRDAILKFEEAKRMIAEGNSAEGENATLAANKALPGHVPAAVLASEIKTRSNERRAAAAIIRKAWTLQPHPDLAKAFAAIEPDEPPQARINRFRQLIGKDAVEPESKMAQAEILLANDDFLGARQVLGKLPEEQPTVRSLAIMAAIERGQGAPDSVVRGWLTKAVSAPRGPQWVCENCQTVHSDWMPACAECEGFDTILWKDVPSAEQIHSSAVGLLPLVISSKGANAALGNADESKPATGPINGNETS